MAASGRERAISAGCVIILHAAMLLLVLHARPPHTSMTSDATLTTFDVAPSPPPPPPQLKDRAPRLAGDAGRAGIKATRNAVVAPRPILAPPLPTIAAPLVPENGTAPIGGTASAGAGTGAGATGSGSGSGGVGDGSGSGGGTRARLVSGTIGPRDYPKAERKAEVEGSVTVSFVVAADGRVQDCTVAQSSGSTGLDTATCRLIAARFRYEPALDAKGRAINERRGWRQRWWIE
jgi:protein TonB